MTCEQLLNKDPSQESRRMAWYGLFQGGNASDIGRSVEIDGHTSNGVEQAIHGVCDGALCTYGSIDGIF